MDPLPGIVFVPGPRGTARVPPPMTRFLGSLRARLMLLHPSPNCSLRAESLVHVHFKEEIGIAELIPLVTTYIILFAYIYFSTRRSQQEAGLSPHGAGVSRSLAPLPLEAAWVEVWGTRPVVTEAGASSPSSPRGLAGSRALASQEKTERCCVPETGKWLWPSSLVNPGAFPFPMVRAHSTPGSSVKGLCAQVWGPAA